MSEEENGNIIIYQSEDGDTKIDVRLENENVWLTQQQMAELYQSSRTNVVEHIKHIYEEGELDKNSTCRNFRQVRLEGNRNVQREIPFYNLVSGYFDFAEIQAMRRKPMYMTDYIKQLDNILSASGEELLNNAGTVSHQQAIEKAKTEYKKYQAKTLSPIEKAYLENLKALQKKIDKKKGSDD